MANLTLNFKIVNSFIQFVYYITIKCYKTTVVNSLKLISVNNFSDFNIIKLIYFIFRMRIGHKKDFFISAMRFIFTVKYRFSTKYFYFLGDRIEIF